MPLARADVRDVCFAHWPVDGDELGARLPAALSPATHDGTAWVSALAQKTRAGLHGVPWRFEYGQLAIRTYVEPTDSRPGDGVGVYFLDVEAASQFASVGARLLYDVPFRYTDVTHRRDGTSFVVDSGAFRARFEPHGDPAVPAPGTFLAWVTDRYRYYLPDGSYGETEHPPWELREATVAVERNDLFDRLDLPEPDGDPVFRYSPGADFRLKRRP